MRTLFAAIILFHALIHLAGYVKASGIREIKELTIPISKPMGFVWLAAAVMLLLYGLLNMLHYRHAWLLGLAAVVLSQYLIITSWKDARWGTLPNIILLLVVLTAMAWQGFEARSRHERIQLLRADTGTADRLLQEEDLAALPAPVKRWLHRTGAVGKPLMRNGRIDQQASMQMKPGQDDWMEARAVQYSTLGTPGFVWTVEARMNSLLFFQGRDKFHNGKGEMLIRLNSLVGVVNQRGGKLDEGALQRFLGEMVWFPSLAVSPAVVWEAIDDSTARATLSCGGISGSGTFHVNGAGDVTRFEALRYKGGEDDAVRYPWLMNISGYDSFGGIRVPVQMTSTWKLDTGDWTWLKLAVTSVSYNIEEP